MGLSKLNMNYFNHGTKFCNADINWFPKIETTINIKLMIKLVMYEFAHMNSNIYYFDHTKELTLQICMMTKIDMISEINYYIPL